ncbi:glycosyltransferase family 4 protein [Trichocoleus sp. FACHB-90]|uniref:glycosyltransferase family 4 protein n=1 Tax=Cyanophyceae TaxID=3028117 RepID=UPI001681D575|nr:glycosyltransferase family 4 protein [Trichocoleus sp. FACHB-90]MBD1924881.1 glycosyltransferase family 4 protein [Trichocoleus sp. FACHB-90]
MRVLYFHQHFTTPTGATGTRSYEMARRLIARGHQVTMVCGSYNMGNTGLTSNFINGVRQGIVEGIEVIEFYLPYSNYDNFLKRSWIFLRFALGSIKLALTAEYDLLFATTTPLTVAIPGIVMKVFKNRPFVFEVRDLWPELPKAMGVITNPLVLKALDILEWLAYHTADACIGLSPGIVKGIVRRKPSAKVTMIPNGCDLDLFKPDPEAKCNLLGIRDDDFVALFCGAHGKANGLDALLDAGKVLKEKGRTDIKLVLIGDGKLKPNFIQRATEEGLDNCLFFQPMPKLELAKVMATANVGLMILANVPAFYYGTSPNKFFDYIACGLPVLNNYPGWLAELIDGHYCGITCPPNDAVAFANALSQLADNRQETLIRGKNARQLAESSFSREALANQFVDYLEKVFQG